MKINDIVKIIDENHKAFKTFGIITGFNPTNEYVNIYVKAKTNMIHDRDRDLILKVGQVEVVNNESI